MFLAGGLRAGSAHYTQPNRPAMSADSSGSRLAGAHPDALLKRNHEYLSVADFPVSRSLDYRINGGFYKFVIDRNFKAHLVKEVYLGYSAPVRFGISSL